MLTEIEPPDVAAIEALVSVLVAVGLGGVLALCAWGISAALRRWRTLGREWAEQHNVEYF